MQRICFRTSSLLSLAMLVACGTDALNRDPGEEPPVQQKDAGAGAPGDSGAASMDAGDMDPGGMDAGATAMDAASSPDDAGQTMIDAGSPTDAGTAGIDLTGVWAARLISAQQLSVPVLGSEPSSLTNIGRAEIVHSGNTATIVLRTCTIDVSPTFGVTTVYPQAAIDALEDTTVAASFGGPLAVGDVSSVPPFVQITGWTSNTPETDALPQEPSDPRVLDQDNDGNPGVTIQATGFINADIYIVGRTTVSLEGTLISADHIQGLNTMNTDQYVLDSDSFLVGNGPIDSEQDPDPTKSTFDLVRLGASGNDCSDILANAGALFP